MITIACDRCAAPISASEESRQIVVQDPGYQRGAEDDRPEILEEFDLCLPCAEALLEWMKPL